MVQDAGFESPSAPSVNKTGHRPGSGSTHLSQALRTGESEREPVRAQAGKNRKIIRRSLLSGKKHVAESQNPHHSSDGGSQKERKTIRKMLREVGPVSIMETDRESMMIRLALMLAAPGPLNSAWGPASLGTLITRHSSPSLDDFPELSPIKAEMDRSILSLTQ